MAVDFKEILNKAKENLFLIPEARFDELTKSKEYGPVLAYFALLVLFFSFMSTVVSALTEAKTTSILAFIIAVPLVYAFGLVLLLVTYGLMHLLLKLVGGKADFKASLQVFVYGSTCSYIFGWIPCVGTLIGLVALANMVIGSIRVHKISLLRAIIALVVIPVIVAVLLALVIAFFAVALTVPTGGLSRLY